MQKEGVRGPPRRGGWRRGWRRRREDTKGMSLACFFLHSSPRPADQRTRQAETSVDRVQGLDLMKIREHVWCKIVVQMRCHAHKISNSPSSRSSASRQAAAAISKPHARRAATAVDLANGFQRAPAVHADVGLSIHFFVMVNHGGARS